MHPTLMLYPLAAMVMLTIAVAFRLGFLRLGAVKARAVDPAYYKARQGTGEPENCATAERAYAGYDCGRFCRLRAGVNGTDRIGDCRRRISLA